MIRKDHFIVSRPAAVRYAEWLNDPTTKEVIEVLRLHAEYGMMPYSTLENPNVGAGLFHQREGMDFIMRKMQELDVDPKENKNELQATYGAQAIIDSLKQIAKTKKESKV